MISRLPKFVKSFYFIVGACVFLWILFFDANDLFNQFKLTKTKNELIAEKEYYKEKILGVKEERKELMSNPKLLEKFAREKYLMKKPTEDIYIVVDEKKESKSE